MCTLPSTPIKYKFKHSRLLKIFASLYFFLRCDTTNIKVFKYFIITVLVIISVLLWNIKNIKVLPSYEQTCDVLEVVFLYQVFG